MACSWERNKILRRGGQEVAGRQAFSISESCQDIAHWRVLPTVQTGEALRQAEVLSETVQSTGRRQGPWVAQAGGPGSGPCTYLQMEMAIVSVNMWRIVVGTAGEGWRGYVPPCVRHRKKRKQRSAAV